MELSVPQSDRNPGECGPRRKEGASIRALVREGFAEGAGPETKWHGAAGTFWRKGRGCNPAHRGLPLHRSLATLPTQSVHFLHLPPRLEIFQAHHGPTPCPAAHAPFPVPWLLWSWPAGHIWEPANLNFDLPGERPTTFYSAV